MDKVIQKTIGDTVCRVHKTADFTIREFDEKKIEKTVPKCYNENNDKLKAEERRNFLWNR